MPDKPNANGRTYPGHEEALARYAARLAQDGPQRIALNPDIAGVTPENHAANALAIDPATGAVTMQVLDTPAGREVQRALLHGGISIPFSIGCRGTASGVGPDGAVQDLRITGFSFVRTPPDRWSRIIRLRHSFPTCPPHHQLARHLRRLRRQQRERVRRTIYRERLTLREGARRVARMMEGQRG